MSFVIEDYIPHRGRIRLLETIIDVEPGRVSSRSTIRPHWPSAESGSVSSLLAIECFAQTVSFLQSWEEKEEPGSGGRGWLVAVKSARFSRHALPVGNSLVIRVEEVTSREKVFLTASGTATLESGEHVADITIQAYKPEHYREG